MELVSGHKLGVQVGVVAFRAKTAAKLSVIEEISHSIVELILMKLLKIDNLVIQMNGNLEKEEEAEVL